MTETTTTPEPATATDRAGRLPLRPADILINLIVAFLAPMFLSASGGNIAYARMAAFETVSAYRIRNQADLLGIAQIVGFGLAAMGSLSLSMADGIPLAMVLRLRGNATSLNRAAEQNRRALNAARAEEEASERQADQTGPDDVTDADAEADAAVEQAQRAAVEATDRIRARQQGASAPPVAPAPVAAPVVAPLAAAPKAALTAEQRRTLWATAMASVAAEGATEIPGLPPAERRVASFRAEVLAGSAHAVLTGKQDSGFNPLVPARVTRPNPEPGVSR
jgi:hypothetical protein